MEGDYYLATNLSGISLLTMKKIITEAVVNEVEDFKLDGYLVNRERDAAVEIVRNTILM